MRKLSLYERPSQDEKPTFNLESVIIEISTQEYLEKQTLHDRFNNWLSLVEIDKAILKDDIGRIWFYEDERPILKATLIEMGNPYLKGFRTGKGYKHMADSDADAEDFYNRMMLVTEELPADLREDWTVRIEILSGRTLRTHRRALFEKIESITEQLNGRSYTEYDSIVEKMNNDLENWMKKNKFKTL